MTTADPNGDFPFMPLYWRDWLTGESTSMMTAEQEGALLNLLLHAWGSDPPCTLPDDDKTLATWSKLGRKWHLSSSLLRAKFDVLPNGRLQNRKQFAVYQDMLAHRETRRAASKKGNAARWGERSRTDRKRIPNGSQTDPKRYPEGVAKPSPSSASADVTDITDTPTSYPSGADAPAADNTAVTPPPEKPPRKKRIRKPRSRKRTTERTTESQEAVPAWSTTAGETWERVQGGEMNYGRIGAALKSLVTEHGEQEVLNLWEQYLTAMCSAGKHGYATPEHFASRYGQVKAKGAVPVVNGNGRPAGPTLAEQHYAEGSKLGEVRWKK